MAEKEEEQRREREAAEAEFDAEEAEHMKKLNQALDEERVDQLRATQKDLLSKVLYYNRRLCVLMIVKWYCKLVYLTKFVLVSV